MNTDCTVPVTFNDQKQESVKPLKVILVLNKKDMKPFHIDRELEGPMLFKDVLSCLRTSYPILERPNTVLERPILF